MPTPIEQASLLERLDRQQDEAIQALDELNTRIEATIREWTLTGPQKRRVQSVSDWSARDR